MVAIIFLMALFFVIVGKASLTQLYFISFLLISVLVWFLWHFNFSILTLSRIVAFDGLMILLFSLAQSDIKSFQLPNQTIFWILAFGLTLSLRSLWISFSDALCSLLSVYALLKGIQWFYRYFRKQEGLGSGDVKFLAAVSTWTGLNALSELLLLSSCWALSAYCGECWRKKILQPKILPFGAYIALAVWFILFMRIMALENYFSMDYRIESFAPIAFMLQSVIELVLLFE